MEISLSVDSYKGVDGSSLSPTRCSQMIQVFEMLEEMGDTLTSYIDIQEIAFRKKLFGSTQAKSAIRTFFPLLKKIHFVDYEGYFPANRCFTELGTQFVLACRALSNVTDDTPNKEEIILRLNRIKQSAQKQGLINMYNDPEWESHNMWVALKLLKELKVLHWNEFLYTLHCLESGETIENSIDRIRKNKAYIDSIIFLNEDREVLPNTCYSYLRSFLEEAGLISKVSSLESKLLESSDIFFSQINI
jgi:hypothetical protein